VSLLATDKVTFQRNDGDNSIMLASRESYCWTRYTTGIRSQKTNDRAMEAMAINLVLFHRKASNIMTKRLEI